MATITRRVLSLAAHESPPRPRILPSPHIPPSVLLAIYNAYSTSHSKKGENNKTSSSTRKQTRMSTDNKASGISLFPYPGKDHPLTPEQKATSAWMKSMYKQWCELQEKASKK